MLSGIEQQEEGVEGEEQSRLIYLMLRWSLGFAFTGFKLIGDAFVSLLSKVLSVDAQVEGRQASQAVVMPFLEYYAYRHSRQFEHDTTDTTTSHLNKAFPQQPSELQEYIARDMELEEAETVEWIGVERVAEAIRRSSKAKKLLGDPLVRLTQTYFEVEFNRQSSLIHKRKPGDTPPP